MRHQVKIRRTEFNSFIILKDWRPRGAYALKTVAGKPRVMWTIGRTDNYVIVNIDNYPLKVNV